MEVEAETINMISVVHTALSESDHYYATSQKFNLSSLSREMAHGSIEMSAAASII